jgi:hypothetical protein
MRSWPKPVRPLWPLPHAHTAPSRLTISACSHVMLTHTIGGMPSTTRGLVAAAAAATAAAVFSHISSLPHSPSPLLWLSLCMAVSYFVAPAPTLSRLLKALCTAPRCSGTIR